MFGRRPSLCRTTHASHDVNCRTIQVIFDELKDQLRLSYLAASSRASETAPSTKAPRRGLAFRATQRQSMKASFGTQALLGRFLPRLGPTFGSVFLCPGHGLLHEHPMNARPSLGMTVRHWVCPTQLSLRHRLSGGSPPPLRRGGSVHHGPARFSWPKWSRERLAPRPKLSFCLGSRSPSGRRPASSCKRPNAAFKPGSRSLAKTRRRP